MRSRLRAALSAVNNGCVSAAPTPLTVRRVAVAGADAEQIGRLVGAYLRHTEAEKAVHLAPFDAAPDAELPAQYRAEVDHPEVAFVSDTAYLAEIAGNAVGVAIARRVGDATEIKRLWAEPHTRGRGIGSALLDAVLHEATGAVRLSVWEWRHPALRLYQSRGFVVVPSWDARPGLVCMQRP